MKTVTVNALQNALLTVSDLIIRSEKRLTAIDEIIGDGDHGIGMKGGFTAVKELLATRRYETVYQLFYDTGIELLKVMGGASGVIFGTLFTGGLDEWKGKESVNADEIILFFDRSFDAIVRRGKSQVGNKTMLDALYPAIEAMKAVRAQTDDMLAIMQAAYEGAVAGVKASENMISKTGRSKNFREKGLGHPDPGAVSVSLIFRGLSQGLQKQA